MGGGSVMVSEGAKMGFIMKCIWQYILSISAVFCEIFVPYFATVW